MDTPILDPLGRTITLHDRTWYGHIVKVHPELAALRRMVGAAIGAPRQVCRSTSDENCRLYYAPGPPARAGQPVLMMCVVADVGTGIVRTAYLAGRIKPGVVEWAPPPRPSKG